MGTYGTLTVYGDTLRTQRITKVYRSMDGYPTCAGAQIFEQLKDVRLVNGYSGSRRPDQKRWANGMSHLAVVASGVWLAGNKCCYAVGVENESDIDWGWFYELYPETDYHLMGPGEGDAVIRLRVLTQGRLVYDGSIADFTKDAQKRAENLDDE